MLQLRLKFKVARDILSGKGDRRAMAFDETGSGAVVR